MAIVVAWYVNAQTSARAAFIVTVARVVRVTCAASDRNGILRFRRPVLRGGRAVEPLETCHEQYGDACWSDFGEARFECPAKLNKICVGFGKTWTDAETRAVTIETVRPFNSSEFSERLHEVRAGRVRMGRPRRPAVHRWRRQTVGPAGVGLRARRPPAVRRCWRRPASTTFCRHRAAARSRGCRTAGGQRSPWDGRSAGTGCRTRAAALSCGSIRLPCAMASGRRERRYDRTAAECASAAADSPVARAVRAAACSAAAERDGAPEPYARQSASTADATSGSRDRCAASLG